MQNLLPQSKTTTSLKHSWPLYPPKITLHGVRFVFNGRVTAEWPARAGGSHLSSITADLHLNSAVPSHNIKSCSRGWELEDIGLLFTYYIAYFQVIPSKNNCMYAWWISLFRRYCHYAILQIMGKWEDLWLSTIKEPRRPSRGTSNGSPRFFHNVQPFSLKTS